MSAWTLASSVKPSSRTQVGPFDSRARPHCKKAWAPCSEQVTTLHAASVALGMHWVKRIADKELEP